MSVYSLACLFGKCKECIDKEIANKICDCKCHKGVSK